MGVMLAVHQSWGKDPDLSELLYKRVKHLDKGLAAAFRTLDGILSGPEALFSWRVDSCLKTPSSVTTISGMVGDSGSLGSGMSAESSLLNTD